MNPGLARLLTRLYPPAWRERYGEEFEELLQPATRLRTSGNVIWSHFVSTSSRLEDTKWINIPILSHHCERTSAFLHCNVLSAPCRLCSDTFAEFGIVHGADEGTAAHIGNYSWLDRFRYWILRNQMAATSSKTTPLYTSCKLELCSLPWPPSFSLKHVKQVTIHHSEQIQSESPNRGVSHQPLFVMSGIFAQRREPL